MIIQLDSHLISHDSFVKFYDKLITYYLSNGINTYRATQYYTMALKRDKSKYLHRMEHILCPIELYKLLHAVSILHHKVYSERSVIIYKNKINFLSKQDTCPICITDKICIPLECVHYMCVYCYPSIIKTGTCPICLLKL